MDSVLPSLKLTPGSESKDWNRWKRAFSLYLQAKDIIDDRRKKALLLTLGGMELQTVYFSLPEAQDDDKDEEAGKLYENTVAALDKFFQPKVNLAFERHMFGNIRQEEDETFDSFVSRLRNQAKICNFGISWEERVCDQIALNCKSAFLRQELLSKQFTSLDDIMNLAKRFEAVQEQHEALGLGNVAEPGVNRLIIAKKERSSNFTPKERSLLARLTNSRARILENKKTDRITNALKNQCWERITVEFNAANDGPPRPTKVLKSKYETMKKELRKKFAHSCRSAEGGHKDPSSPPHPEDEIIKRGNMTFSFADLKPSASDLDAGCSSGISPCERETEEVVVFEHQPEVVIDWTSASPLSLQTRNAEELSLPLLSDSSESTGGRCSEVLGTDATNTPSKETSDPEPRNSLLLVQGDSVRRRLLKRHSRSSASSKFGALAAEKIKLAKKKELLLDLQIDLCKKQHLIADMEIAKLKQSRHLED